MTPTTAIASTAELLTLRRAIERVLDPHSEWEASGRLIYCTPIHGAYGHTAFWAIVLEGSPPKVTVLVHSGWNDQVPHADYGYGPMPILIDCHGKSKKLTARRVQPLNDLLTALNARMSPDSMDRSYLGRTTLLEEPRAFIFELDGAGRVREHDALEDHEPRARDRQGAVSRWSKYVEERS